MADLLSMTNKKNDDKQKMLQTAIDRLDKQYGKGTVMRLGDKQVS